MTSSSDSSGLNAGAKNEGCIKLCVDGTQVGCTLRCGHSASKGSDFNLSFEVYLDQLGIPIVEGQEICIQVKWKKKSGTKFTALGNDRVLIVEEFVPLNSCVSVEAQS